MLVEPLTSRLYPGAVVPIPILEFCVSKFNNPLAKLRAVIELGKANVDAAPAVKFNAPAELSTRVPDVVVWSVRFESVVPIVRQSLCWRVSRMRLR
ncbi:MAG: hypothetical protein UU80_C0043G0005 [candidate division WWE3 bacterium GW2011_GWA1_41_8]|uniref:Uncharacterized protein n=1 Tax=candidate division WWE3 bacterium GW2011_GWA1_41_8 TaxID=1619103 RepID=A0A0G0X6U6_UNCKA|nr:MAG: hypothetical protein UU80_C0043G0005 [candidate division WWE3 bacterium GW2011_GWA1_41_8]